MEKYNVKIVKQIYEDFGKGNIPGILNVLADDIEWKEPDISTPPFTGTIKGNEEVGEFFRKINETIYVEKFEPREFIAHENKIIVFGYYQFRSRLTGKTWDTDWIMVWQFKNAKITKFQIYKDSAAEKEGITK